MQNENWVNYAEVKATVKMEAVLSHYGVALRRVNKTYLRGRCPLPTHTSEGSNSFSVQTEKNVWACQSQSCGKARGGRKGGNVLDFVAALESCTVRVAALILQKRFMGEGAEIQNRAAASPPELVAKKKEPVGEQEQETGRGVVNNPLPFALRGIDTAHSYLTHRGIKRETAEHFGTGFFPGKGSMSGRIVIPIHNAQGELIAYAGRALDEATEPRYKLPGGFNKSAELYNLHRAMQAGRGQVIVVEGFFDTMKLYQAGFPSAVALMGSSLSDVQADLLGAFDRAILMLDGDDAGREAGPKIAADLARRLAVRIATVPDGKQPDMLSSEEIKRILDPLF